MSIKVWAHHSGQRLNWAYSREAVKTDQQRWYQTQAALNNYPHECVGGMVQVSLSDIDENDVYVG